MSHTKTQSNALATLSAPTTPAGLLRGPAHASSAVYPCPPRQPSRDGAPSSPSPCWVEVSLRAVLIAGCQVGKTPQTPDLVYTTNSELILDRANMANHKLTLEHSSLLPGSSPRPRPPSPARCRLGAPAAAAIGRPRTPFQLPELQIPGCLSDCRSLPLSLPPSVRSLRPRPLLFWLEALRRSFRESLGRNRSRPERGKGRRKGRGKGEARPL